MLASHPLPAGSGDSPPQGPPQSSSGADSQAGRQADGVEPASQSEHEARGEERPAGPSQQSRPARPATSSGGRPPLPRMLPASSAASSRASSPRSTVSTQSSLQAQNAAKLAQYRAGARTFKPDSQPRKGLDNGDVVAFRTQGLLMAATELGTDPQEVSTVHFAFQPTEQAEATSNLTHLEVVRQGKWVGFRCAAAGDRFLQARKRSPNRLVFFSQNMGTWEQWELGPGAPDPDAADWASLALTLRHRRLPQFELAVEVVRVGSVSLPLNASITPRTLLAGGEQAAAAAAAEEDNQLERRELKRMSGVLLHEWLHYVDQEKAARMAIEARVAQMAEDAAGLRTWAVMQVDSVRREMDEEVGLLLEAIQRKSTKLADVEMRLTGRLRWGVAMIQAKSELSTKRQVFAWWRCMTARKKYSRHVEAKLQQRSALRLQARVLEAWMEYKEHKQAVQATLRAAVRRMYYVKLYHAFTAWQDLVAFKRQQEGDHAALVDAVCQHMQRWRLRRLLRRWQHHAEGCAQGRQLLLRMAARSDQQAMATAFAAWRTFVGHQQERVASFSALVATRQAQRAQQEAFQGWRLLVDDEYGSRLQLQHAQHVLARLRARHVLCAWHEWQAQRADRRQRWDAIIAYMRQRAAAICLGSAFGAWQDHAALEKEKQALFYNAVQHMALRKMSVAFQYWRYLTTYRQHVRNVVAQSVDRLSRRTLLQAWAAWQQYVADARVARHRIAVCQRRQELGMQRSVLAGWRQVAAVKAAERQMVQLCQKRADRNRLSVALAAFQLNAEHQAARREQEHMAVDWYAETLQAKAFAALAEAVERRRLFEQQLAAVALSVQQDLVKEAFSSWRAAAAMSTSEAQLVAAAQRRFARMRLQGRFQAWRAAAQERQQQEARLQRHLRQRAAHTLQAAFVGWQAVAERERWLQQRLELAVGRIAQMRLGWALDVWRQTTAASVAEQQLVAAGQRRIARIRLTAAFAGWQQHAAHLTAARATAEELGAGRDAVLAQDCLLGWAAVAARRAQQQAAMIQLVQRRAEWMTLSVLHAWQDWVQQRQQCRSQLQRVTRKLAGVCQQHAFSAWRQQAAWQRAEAARLAVAERRVATRHAARTLAAAFSSWRGHVAALEAARQAVEAKVQAEGVVVVRHVLAAWRSHTEQQAVRHDHILRVCVARQCTLLQSKALVAWQLFAQRQAHNREAVEVTVHRMARRVMHAALLSWRQAAQERRVRRTAIARFIQRWDAHRKAAALAHWRRLLAERQAAEDNLRRCLVRKRVAFRLFRQWYWESFDDDMQETLRTMFEITEEAALDPLPSRAGSPYGSLLSSPIRQQVYGMGRQQQLQLNSSVAAALAKPGALQPAFMHAAEGQQQADGSAGLPQPPQRKPLSSRLAAAASSGAAASARSAPPVNLSSSTLAPLREYAAFALQSNGVGGLDPVPEVAESPYAARSPAGAGYGTGHSASLVVPPSIGRVSSTASTVLPNSPLTPASAYAGGASTPLTGVSRLATPGAEGWAGASPLQLQQQQQVSPSGLSAARTPGMGGLADVLSAQRQQQSSSSPLSDAPTPGYSLGGSQRELLGMGGMETVMRTPLSSAGTPRLDYDGMPLSAGYGGGGFAASPATSQQYADAPTPSPHLGLQGKYEIRRFSDGTQYVAPAGTPQSAGSYGTPLDAYKTPQVELQGDYSIRAFPGSTASQRGQQQQQGAAAGGMRSEDLSAAKTPIIHVNPLAM